MDSSKQEAVGLYKTLKLTTIDLVGGINCHICFKTFHNKKEYDSHYIKEHNIAKSNIVYTCVVCKKAIVGYRPFRGHCYTEHVVKDRFKCEHCAKTFCKQSVLQGHINIVHNKKFKCNKQSCTKLFSTKEKLHAHEILHKNEMNKPPYQCQTCDNQIDCLDTCERHVDQHCIFQYSCPICNESFTKDKATEHLTKHFNDTLNEDTFEDTIESEMSEDSSITIAGGIFCCSCEALLKNRLEFDAHFTSNHYMEALVYTCNICKKQFEKYALFSNHCHSHCTRNRYQCDLCDKFFSRLSMLVVHTEAFHAGRGDAKPFRCVQCGHSFHSNNRMREHQRAAHDIHCYRCPEPDCDRTFEASKDLVLHQKDHKSDLYNWCRQCGLQFTSLASCIKHLDVHKKKLFMCPVCGRQYGEKYLMMNHLPQHFELVLYMCKTCGKVFNRKNQLVEHSRTHSSTKDFKCDICGKDFARAYHLQSHLSMHTGTRPYKCVACPKAFAGYPNWSKHMRKMHNIDSRNVKKPVIDNVKISAISKLKPETPKSVDYDFKTDISTPQSDSIVFYVSDQCMDSDSIDSVPAEVSDCFDTDMNPLIPSDNICELTNLQPDNSDLFLSEVLPPECLSAETPPLHAVDIPREYGPDFVSCDFLSAPGELIDLNDDPLPHINPLLTINQDQPIEQYIQNVLDFDYDNFPQNIVDTIDKWEPPVITKVFGNFYGDMDDMNAGRLTAINTDVF